MMMIDAVCGCHWPEQVAWRWTWILAGLCQSAAQLTLPDTQLHRRFVAHSPRWLRRGARVCISFHAVSSVFVGVFALQPHQCRESVQHIVEATALGEMRLDRSALMHYAAAVCAGIGGLVGIPMALAAWHCAFEHAHHELSQDTLRALKRVWLFKAVCAALMYAALFAMVCVGPLCVFVRGHVSRDMANFLSLSEWMLGLPMGLYDACLSLEDWIVVEALNDSAQMRLQLGDGKSKHV